MILSAKQFVEALQLIGNVLSLGVPCVREMSDLIILNN